MKDFIISSTPPHTELTELATPKWNDPSTKSLTRGFCRNEIASPEAAALAPLALFNTLLDIFAAFSVAALAAIIGKDLPFTALAIPASLGNLVTKLAPGI